jgi:YVTN family beta-propeller protein
MKSDNNVSVINTATNMVVATVPMGDDPRGVAVTPNGKETRHPADPGDATPLA